MKKIVLLLIIVCAVYVNVNAQSRHTSRTAEPAEPPRDERRDDQHRHHNNPEPHVKQQPMWVATPEQVQLMIEQLNRLSFSQDKVDFAYFCVKLLPIPAEGIMRLAATMSFDNSKLEFLKEAFRFCPDPYNYIIVEEALTFSTNAAELRSYIEREYNFRYAY